MTGIDGFNCANLLPRYSNQASMDTDQCPLIQGLTFTSNSADHKETHDPILSFQLANDFEVKRLLKDYNQQDEKPQG